MLPEGSLGQTGRPQYSRTNGGFPDEVAASVTANVLGESEKSFLSSCFLP